MAARVLKAPEVALTAAGSEAREGVRVALVEAFDQGREQGRLEATAALEHEVAALRRHLADAVAETRVDVVATSTLDAETLVTLAADLATWFLDGAVAVDAGAVTESMRGALATVANEPGLVLHVHPRLAAALGDGGALGLDAVRPDDTLDPADFRLASDTTIVERRWRDAIDAIRPDLVAAVQAGDG